LTVQFSTSSGLFNIKDIFKYFKLVSHERTTSREAGIAAGLELNGRGIGVRFPAGAKDFSPLYSVQTGSVSHPAFYTMATDDSAG
jgi:hypothetical protein